MPPSPIQCASYAPDGILNGDSTLIIITSQNQKAIFLNCVGECFRIDYIAMLTLENILKTFHFEKYPQNISIFVQRHWDTNQDGHCEKDNVLATQSDTTAPYS